MNFNAESRTILLVRHGSHAYGLATPESDIDRKGVCIEPKCYHLGFLHKFEQEIREARKGNPFDQVIYSLKKFGKLAADCNPNIIEVMFCDASDIVICDRYGEWLLSRRIEFLSKKAKHTFSGYAFAQLKKIKSHRAWLLNPPTHIPERKDYGLGEEALSDTQFGAYAALDSETRKDLTDEALSLYSRERAYRTARMHWSQYQEWKKNRNPARAAMEAKAGYDCKHASHLIRLLRMCGEILSGQGVIVKRPDREEILEIKRGEWSYDRVIEHAEMLEKHCEALYEKSPLRHSPDAKALDNLIVEITEDYLSKHG